MYYTNIKDYERLLSQHEDSSESLRTGCTGKDSMSEKKSADAKSINAIFSTSKKTLQRSTQHESDTCLYTE